MVSYLVALDPTFFHSIALWAVLSLLVICLFRDHVWQPYETVRSFKYLGAIVSDEGSKPEVLSWIAQTTAAVTKLKVIWNDKNITISSKIRLMRSLAMFIFLYACETRTIN